MHHRSIAATARLVVLLGMAAASVQVLRSQEHVDLSELAAAPPVDAVVSVVRLAALALAGWLLLSTLAYLLARATRVPALIRATGWATLPAVRRIVDAAVAASFIGSAAGMHPVAAQVLAPPPIVVDLTTTSVPGHLYVPIPAGDSEPVSVPASTATAAPSKEAPPRASSPNLEPEDSHVAHTHTVVAGDNLWTIAEAELLRQSGRTADHLAEVEIRNYWIKVIIANREHLRSGNPNLIYPGEPIICPAVD